MLVEWLAPLMAWMGVDFIGLCLLVIILVLIVKGD